MFVPFHSMYYGPGYPSMLNYEHYDPINPLYNTNGLAGRVYEEDYIAQKAKKSQTADSTKAPEKQPVKRNKKKIKLRQILLLMYWMNQNNHK